MADGTYILALGVAPGGVECPGGTATLINSGNITLNQSGNFFYNGQHAIEVFFSGANMPTKLEFTIEVTTGGPGGTPACTPNNMVITNEVLSQYALNGLLYLQQFYNPPGNIASPYSNWDPIIPLVAGTEYTFAMYCTPTGGKVTIGTSNFGNVGGGWTVYLHPAATFSSVTPINGGVQYNT